MRRDYSPILLQGGRNAGKCHHCSALRLSNLAIEINDAMVVNKLCSPADQLIASYQKRKGSGSGEMKEVGHEQFLSREMDMEAVYKPYDFFHCHQHRYLTNKRADYIWSFLLLMYSSSIAFFFVESGAHLAMGSM